MAQDPRTGVDLNARVANLPAGVGLPSGGRGVAGAAYGVGGGGSFGQVGGGAIGAAGVGGGVGGAGNQGAAAVAPGTVTNNVAANPANEAFQAQVKDRIAQSQAKEGQADPYQQESINNLRGRLSADTTGRAIDVANRGVNSAAGTAQGALRENLARRGLSGGAAAGVGAELSQKISADAARAKAGNAASISLGREGQLDSLTLGGAGIMNAPSSTNLAQQGLTNNVLGQQGANLAAQGQQQLGQQNLNLNQWQAQNQNNLAQQQLAAQQQQQQQAQQLALLQMRPIQTNTSSMY